MGEHKQELKPKTKAKRQRVVTHQSLAKYLYQHSPIKAGIKIKDEDKPLEKYSKIMNKLYLGNQQAAKDREFFDTKHIKAVLNCTRDIPNHFSHLKDSKGVNKIEYMRIPVEDSLKQKDFDLMYEFFPCIVEFIHKHLVILDQPLFVHCWAGRQRSAISIAAYLVAKKHMTPKEACKFILDHRKEGFHFGTSLNFDVSLEKYYKKLQRDKCKK